MRFMGYWRLAGVALVVISAAPASAQVRTRAPLTRPVIAQPTAGRYRVVVSGFATVKETRDEDNYGNKDEVYAAAAFFLWDRRDGRLISIPNTIRTREYGDIGGFNGPRLQAGSASQSGGLWGGNGADYVPVGLDPRAPTGPVPQSDQLPLLVFEGGLSDGVEALLVAPSLWEADGLDNAFVNYASNWRTGGVAKLLGSPAVQNQLANPSLTSAMLPGDFTLQAVAVLANIFTGGVVGSYMIGAPQILTSRIDRPIGLTPLQNSKQYQDRLVVITREKLAGLAVGGGTTIAVPFAEPFDNQLNGMYTLYLRIERIQ